MTEYNCYEYAIELGFTEEEARSLQASKMGKGQDATVLRRLATVKGLASMKPKYPMPSPDLELPPDAPQSTPSPVTPPPGGKPLVKRKGRAGKQTKAKRG